MRPKVFKLTYDSLIALLQGKDLHVQDSDAHFIFKPPFDGVYMTHEQLAQLRQDDLRGALGALTEVGEHTN